MYDANFTLKIQQPILFKNKTTGMTKNTFSDDTKIQKNLLEQIINFFLVCLSFILLLLVFPAGD